MPDCEWDCQLKCVHCGYVARKPGTRRTCSIERRPSVTSQLSSYAAAVSRWLATGRPVRTDEQVGELLSICQDNRCGKYRDGQCLACGCRVNSSGWALANKLRMATEECPKKLWPIALTNLRETCAKPAPHISFDVPNVPNLRVGILTPNLYVGGVESWLLSLAKEWNRSGSVDLIGIGHIGVEGTHQQTLTRQLAHVCPIVTACQIDGAHVVRSPLDAAGTVAAAADVLIVWSCPADILARVKRPGQTVVGVSHGCHDWWMGAAAPLVDRWAAVSADAVGPVPTDPASVQVIPNGVDLERCRSTLPPAIARERLGILGPGPIAGYCGRISAEKRVREIAQAAQELPPHWRVLIVGTAANAAYEAEVRAACGPRVTWVNRSIADVGDVWRACTVGVIASAAEGYCLAAVELLAAGVPLASTEVGIVRQITDHVTVIPQPAEPAAIAAAVVAAARKQLSLELAAWTEQQSAAKMAARWAKFLNEVHHGAGLETRPQ